LTKFNGRKPIPGRSASNREGKHQNTSRYHIQQSLQSASSKFPTDRWPTDQGNSNTKTTYLLCFGLDIREPGDFKETAESLKKHTRTDISYLWHWVPAEDKALGV